MPKEILSLNESQRSEIIKRVADKEERVFELAKSKRENKT